MRTTLTIDDQIAADLKKRAFESGKSFKTVVNEALARGLARDTSSKRSRKKFKTPRIALGDAAVDLTKSLDLSGRLEDEELARKLELRK